MSARSTWRQEFAEMIPYVRRLVRGGAGRCQGYRRMSAKARRDPALRERYRCKNDARWSYTYLRTRGQQNLTKRLCWSHLMSHGFHSWSEEQDRYDRWRRDHLDEVNEFAARHGLPQTSREGHEGHEA